ncbi:MAG: hypothetical protein QM426_09165 [Euryarchaeota archaeon]|nr:hypothetical protein [Euryarchaeota archaeon]
MANYSCKTADLGRFKMANYFLMIVRISRNQSIPVSIKVSELHFLKRISIDISNRGSKK